MKEAFILSTCSWCIQDFYILFMNSTSVLLFQTCQPCSPSNVSPRQHLSTVLTFCFKSATLVVKFVKWDNLVALSWNISTFFFLCHKTNVSPWRALLAMFNRVPALSFQLSRNQAEIFNFKHCRSPSQSFSSGSVEMSYWVMEYKKIIKFKGTCPFRYIVLKSTDFLRPARSSEIFIYTTYSVHILFSGFVPSGSWCL